MSIFLGIDSGTQSTKAIALDLDSGRVVAEARASHTLIAGLPAGHMEQHPAEWVAALDRVIREVAAKIDRTRVRGIGISGQQHGFVPLDAAGAVIRPAKLWNDTSTTQECALLTKKLGGPNAVIRAAGLPFLPGYTAPKILWLKRNEPANYRRLRHVLLPHDYLNFHLTGKYFMEHGDASGTALMDVRHRTWSKQVIRAIDKNLADWLPALSASGDRAGTLRPELANKYGLSADVVISAGGGDNMMSAIGTGNVVPGVVSASLGTSGTIFAFSKRPVVDPHGEIAAFCSSTGGWLPLLCTMNVTLVTEQFRALSGTDHVAMERAIAAVPAGADGLRLLPYLSGERTPNLPHGHGILDGVTTRNLERGHLLRAAMEGVTVGMNYGLLRLRKLGIKPREIRLTGGGAKSPVWRQIMADVFGVPVVSMVEDEGAALGGALQAAACVDPAATLPTLCDRFVELNLQTRCAPNPRNTAVYAEIADRHATLRTLFGARRASGSR
ncbi:xylulokinase [Opitutus sp. GAS368]|uniref:xylulokinase n=1 Tax=Opitutus sp. GAS368 TaxID=1882749 RepID=UPI00087B272F|nr:xylulokinase [Opitutus sp. GAS368]SDS19389.1 xylulokinase [Opitutus sp. GAS368]